MRIGQDLSNSLVRKAGKSLTLRCAARFTWGRSGRTPLGPDRCHEGEPGHSRRSQHFCQRFVSARLVFCLFGRLFVQKCLNNLRSICSVDGYLTQGSANTSDFARGVLAVGNPGFLDISRHFTVHPNSPRMPSSARGSNGGPRRFTAIVHNVSRRRDDAQVPATRR
jgi:hypothetical protein